MSVAGAATGVARIRFGPPPMPTDPAPAPVVATALRQLAEYFTGRLRVFDLPLDWSQMAETRRRVLKVLAGSVGYGQTITYGALAEAARVSGDGTMLPARTVGQIMASNPFPLVVPCHRVVASDGLGGFSGGTGIEVKRWLLTFEGVLPPTLDWQ